MLRYEGLLDEGEVDGVLLGAVRHLGSRMKQGAQNLIKAQIKESLLSDTSTGEVWSVYR